MTKIPTPRPAIARMSGYTPGEQPRLGEIIIKLNTNENPYPPSPQVMKVLRSLDPEALRRYPNPTADAFRDLAARRFGLSREQVLAGNGSDDILAIAVRTFLDQGDRLAYPDPTYSLYPVLAAIQGVQTVEIPWLPGWRLPCDALLGSGARAVFFANPNAPSGTVVSPAEVETFAGRFEGLVLVDEAYVDFADENCLPLLSRRPNVLISRTLSKAYSLCGLRFGFALGHPDVIAQMMKVKDSYNCDAVSIAAACAALEDEEYARSTWQAIHEQRTRIVAELERRGWDVIPSHANFIFARPPGGNGEEIYRSLKAQGILVRHFARPGLDERVRISVGSPAENDALLARLPRA